MKSNKNLISALVKTSAMTLFSYLVTESKNKSHQEPEKLDEAVLLSPESDSEGSTNIAGWGMNYALGTLLVAGYNQLLIKTKEAPSLTTGTLLGAASGVVGVVGWKLLFKAQPHPEAKKLNPFFSHLIIAHVVFGVFSALTPKLTDDNKNP